MNEETTKWLFDPQVLDYVKWTRMESRELLIALVGLSLLALYILVVVFLERKAKSREKWRTKKARLNHWIKLCRLTPEEQQLLQGLSGGKTWKTIYRLLGEPAFFETQVHKALSEGPGTMLIPLADRVRFTLRNRSTNLTIPVVSTRQLVAGDVFHLWIKAGSEVRHVFAWVIRNLPRGVLLEMTGEGNRNLAGGMEVDAFFLRGEGMEYRFPWQPQALDEKSHTILLNHAMVAKAHRPRRIRLPLGHEVPYQVLEALDKPPVVTAKGVLLELSEGGFTVLQKESVPIGHYARVVLSGPKSGDMPLTGKVLHTQSFPGRQWLLRCEMRKLSPAMETTLSRLITRELERRLNRAQAKRRKTMGGASA